MKTEARAVRFISVIVELSRGTVIESVHHVDAVVVGPDGPVVAWGNPERSTIARSALKFVQAIPLLRTGAADAFAVSPEEITLACASHSGEQAHIDAVAVWLDRLDLSPTALECGPMFPLGKQAVIDHHQRKAPAEPLVHCCSGKHTGFLTVARHLDVDPKGYIEPGHPVQQLVTEAVAELTGCSLGDQPPGRDGCGIPTYGIALSGLATAMARLADPTKLEPATASAAERLIDSAIGREFWISGTGRCEMRLAEVVTERLLVKVGAEGVFMAALPDRQLGIALKAVDGAERAAEAAIWAILALLGAVPQRDGGTPIRNAAGAEVGQISVDCSAPVLDRL